MKTYIRTTIITHGSEVIFLNELQRVVSEIQKRGNEAEVQYSSSTICDVMFYTALILEIDNKGVL